MAVLCHRIIPREHMDDSAVSKFVSIENVKCSAM